jgi:EmrB/QacA subfamily drug resistance transporter
MRRRELVHPNTEPALLPARRRWAALIVLCAGMLMVILDGTVVTVALPSIQRELGFSAADLSWVVGAYLIPFGGLLLLAGRLGDLAGRRKVFLIGVAAFTLASALCGVATGPAMLIAARFLQGAAGAVASAGILGMVVGLFPDRRERARAIGIYSFIGAGGAAIGLLAGGVLTQTLGWHWVFLVNVPIGTLTVLTALRVLPVDRPVTAGRGRDVPGALLITTGLMLTVYTITESPARGWTSPITIGTGALGGVLVAAFVIRERVARDPLLPLRFLRDRPVWVANLVQFLMVGALFAFQFMLGVYLQNVLGFGPGGTGLAFLPITAVIGLFSLLITPWLLLRWGGRAVLLAGLTLIAAGLAVLARVPTDAQFAVDVLPATLAMGAGGGLTLPALASLGMSTASDRDSGLASGLLNTTQQVGGALGLAVLTSLAAARTAGSIGLGGTATSALTDGYRLGFGVGAVIVMAALILAAAALRPAPSPHVPVAAEDGSTNRGRRRSAPRPQ